MYSFYGVNGNYTTTIYLANPGDDVSDLSDSHEARYAFSRYFYSCAGLTVFSVPSTLSVPVLEDAPRARQIARCGFPARNASCSGLTRPWKDDEESQQAMLAEILTHSVDVPSVSTPVEYGAGSDRVESSNKAGKRKQSVGSDATFAPTSSYAVALNETRPFGNENKRHENSSGQRSQHIEVGNQEPLVDDTAKH